MAPTRQEANQALEQLTYPNHPAGQPDLDNFEAAITGYMDELEERLEAAGGTLPGEEEDEQEPQNTEEPETEGTAASTEGPSESTGEGGSTGDDIPTSTGPGGSAEGAPGV